MVIRATSQWRSGFTVYTLILGARNYDLSNNPTECYNGFRSIKRISMNIEQKINDLKEAITNFLVPIQTKRVLDLEAFLALNKVVETLAQMLKGTDNVSKSMLNEIYITIQIMRAEAPYVKEQTAAIETMASKLEYCFALILRNESPSDRLPGRPRIM